ncbi:MAG TPA: hypothetical protein VGM39_25220 [Kofleriaceae bacterium]|jgi:hypothetical protein
MLHRALVLATLLTGCAGVTSNFHSKTGRVFPQVVHQAVICGEEECKDVEARAVVVGTIDSKQWDYTLTDDDLHVNAAELAARRGGTHLVVLAKQQKLVETQVPASSTTTCYRGHVCETTYEVAGTRTDTYTVPGPDYLVVRVEPNAWSALPPSLQPVP